MDDVGNGQYFLCTGPNTGPNGGTHFRTDIGPNVGPNGGTYFRADVGANVGPNHVGPNVGPHGPVRSRLRRRPVYPTQARRHVCSRGVRRGVPPMYPLEV